jgi:hypothetical protein
LWWILHEGRANTAAFAYIQVKAPWVFHAVLEDGDDGNYIIPK